MLFVDAWTACCSLCCSVRYWLLCSVLSFGCCVLVIVCCLVFVVSRVTLLRGVHCKLVVDCLLVCAGLCAVGCCVL